MKKLIVVFRPCKTILQTDQIRDSEYLLYESGAALPYSFVMVLVSCQWSVVCNRIRH